MNYSRFQLQIGILLLACVLIISACQKRYWYRTKINAQLFAKKTPPRRTINIEILNFSPDFLSKDFERSIQEASLLELNKRGFVLEKKDTPNFHLFIYLHVDSYFVYGSRVSFFGNRYGSRILSKSQTSPIAGNYYTVLNRVKSLEFSYRMIAPKDGSTYWESSDELYFFDKEKRDIRRSKSLVTYNLSLVP